MNGWKVKLLLQFEPPDTNQWIQACMVINRAENERIVIVYTADWKRSRNKVCFCIENLFLILYLVYSSYWLIQCLKNGNTELLLYVTWSVDGMCSITFGLCNKKFCKREHPTWAFHDSQIQSIRSFCFASLNQWRFMKKYRIAQSSHSFLLIVRKIKPLSEKFRTFYAQFTLWQTLIKSRILSSAHDLVENWCSCSSSHNERTIFHR